MEPTHTLVEAVLFDYGQVLSGPPNPAAWARMREISGLDEAALQHGYWSPRHDYDRGTHTGRAYWRLVAGDRTLTPAQIDALIDADTALWTDLNLPMLEWAQGLQQAGIRTGILSNLGDAMAAGVLAKFSWISRFDHCTWSHTLRLAKPEPAIYSHAAAGLGTPIEHILFIDDRADNVEGARAAGMQVIQYSGHQAFVAEMELRGFDYLLHLKHQPASPAS